MVARSNDVLCEILVALMPADAKERLEVLRGKEPLVLERERRVVQREAALNERERRFALDMEKARTEVQALHDRATQEMSDATSIRIISKKEKLEADLLMERARAKLENAGKLEAVWNEKIAALQAAAKQFQA